MAKVKRLEKNYVRHDDAGAVTKERTGVPTGEFTFKFLETGNEMGGTVLNIPGMTAEIWASLPNVVKELAMHGLMQKGGDPAAGETGEDVEEAVTATTEMILAGNFYAERVKGEARPSMVAEAVWAFKKESGTVKTDPADGIEKAFRKDGTGESLAQIVARYAGKDGAKARADATNTPRVKVILATMREEAAKARREAAEKKAGEATGKGAEADAL